MDDIHSGLLQLYCDLVNRAEVLDREGLSQLAELLRDEAEVVMSRFAELRLRTRQSSGQTA